MPELPEVETVVRDLRPRVVGRRISGLRCGPKKLRRPWKTAWTKQITLRKILAIHRRGKWIVIDLTQDRHLIVHLGMTGQFTVQAPEEALADHTHLVFELTGGLELRFRDVRRFGSIEYFASARQVGKFLGERLGPEPEHLPADAFAAQVQATRSNLKAVLLDQTIVAGVGNIYADESLFHAGLNPRRRGSSLSRAECDRLRQSIQDVIRRAVAGRGSTIRDYIGGSGLRGEFQHEFAVYGRTGEPCPRCNAAIEMVRLAGRSSHYCPQCQPVAT